MSSRHIGFAATSSLFALGVLCAPACAPLRLPYRAGAPAASREGVEIAVNRQSCTQDQEPEFYGEDLVEEVVELQVKNATGDAVTLQRDAFLLISPDGRGLKTLTWKAIDPLALSAGETRTFQLRYMPRGGLECAREMKLDFDGGVKINGRPVALGVVTFQPSHTL